MLAAIGGGVLLLTDDDSGKRTENGAAAPSPGRSDGPGRQRGGSGGGSSDAPSPEQQAPQTEDGYATDMASGISIPVPGGWTGKSGSVGAGVTTGSYACPGDTSQECVRGGVSSAPAIAMKLNTTTAEATATQDIKANAEESYGEKVYGGITSHQQLKSGAVTVAGQKGYLVRWKVVTKNGEDGYVQSLAFPSPHSQDMLVVVRSGFDIDAKAPKLSVMDDITRGIKAASGSGSGAGATA